MTSLVIEPLEIFCGRHGVCSPFLTERIRAGRNSVVSRLTNSDGQWILKQYYQHVSDKRDRLGTEFSFLTFLKNAGVSGVSEPLAMDRVSHHALYSFLPGKRPVAITSTQIVQAANFIGNVNLLSTSADAMALPAAADACFSWKEHLDLVATRIGRLSAVRPESGLELEAYEFVEQQLSPFWSRLKNKLLQEIGSSQLAEPLPSGSRIISPSDFGFHNTLEEKGDLSFVDFEYAGWDDPVKLICDFTCQPELPVSVDQGRQFMEELLPSLPHSDAVWHRVESLLPVHRLKWCCILLNEFRSEDRQRRLHAGVEFGGLLADQLCKAKQYFNMHIATSI
jgi:hypothetical protein